MCAVEDVPPLGDTGGLGADAEQSKMFHLNSNAMHNMQQNSAWSKIS